MHSPFEISSKVDIWNFYRFMEAFLGSVPATEANGELQIDGRERERLGGGRP